jgi:hypothetical protein
MGLFNKLKDLASGKIPGSEGTKEKIKQIFESKVKDGNEYVVYAGFNMVTTKKLLKEIRTFYNYIIGYKNGDDPEIVVIPTDYLLEDVGEPIYLKKSQCTKIENLESKGLFHIEHPDLEDGNVYFMINVSKMFGTYTIDVSYIEEYTDFFEFFNKRFLK